MTAEDLIGCLGCTEGNARRWAGPLTEAMDCNLIHTPVRQAAFMAQIGHESGLLTRLEENLNYNHAALLGTFPKHFSVENVDDYVRHPEKIANRAYANRMGNGDEASGDGWRFRGRGLIQLTGRESYDLCGKALRIDLIADPDLLLQERHAADSAGWEWDTKLCNNAIDSGNFEKVCRLINGGLNGYASRLELWNKAKTYLGV
jgi:putative chitinase